MGCDRVADNGGDRVHEGVPTGPAAKDHLVPTCNKCIPCIVAPGVLALPHQSEWWSFWLSAKLQLAVL